MENKHIKNSFFNCIIEFQLIKIQIGTNIIDNPIKNIDIPSIEINVIPQEKFDSLIIQFVVESS